MLSRVSVVLALCLLAGINNALGERVRYDNYRLFKVVPSDKMQLDVLKEMEGFSDSLIFLQTLNVPNQEIGVITAPHKVDDLVTALKMNEMQHELVEPNFQRILDEEIAEHEAIQRNNNLTDAETSKYSWNVYQTLEDTYDWMNDLTSKYPSVVQVINAGTSYERRRILGVKISKDKFRTNKPGILLESGMHAREWIAPATVTYIVNQLLTSTDPKVKALFEKYNWYVIPHANPDGFVYSHTKNRLWRKTRSPQRRNCFGADPNRNWDFHFGEAGVSRNPCAEDYPGPRAFSEIETKSFSKYLSTLKGKVQLYLAFHSYSQLFLYPYGYTSRKAPNDKDLNQVFKVTVDAISKRYGTKYTGGNIYDAIYPASGSSMEWAYDKIGTKMAFTYELRPSSNVRNGFILPAKQIIPTAEETLDSLIAMVKEIEKLGYFKLRN